jgi:U3 small nucleolar RNA-associated protein 3
MQDKVVQSTAGLTFDEAMAVEYYGATKRKRQAIEAGSDGESDGDEEHQVENDLEGNERRGITYEMSKNKGLQPKRSKIQRNPRVKHRKKFEKAKVRRKGQVREVRKETKKYAGEMSGINKRVKKGIKLA